MPHAIDTTDVPECLSCGTCCFSSLPEFIRVFGVDYDRMDESARGLTHFISHRCYMRLEEGHCAALRIDPVERRFVCSIYEMRPDCCRALERGSGACRGERHEKTDRPLIAVAALFHGRGRSDAEAAPEASAVAVTAQDPARQPR